MLLVKLFKGYIGSGLDWKAELDKVLGKKKFLPAETVELLAEAMAEAYGEKYGETIYYQQTRSGAWCFFTDEACTSASRHTTCLRQWQREVEPFHKLTKQSSGGVSKQVDEVAKLVEKFEALTKAQQAKFLRIVS